MMPGWLAGLIFFSVLGLLVGSQAFWFWRARKLVRSRPQGWQRWALGAPLYGWVLLPPGGFLGGPPGRGAGPGAPLACCPLSRGSPPGERASAAARARPDLTS